jgi:uncharacterized membrane protein
MNVFLHTSSKQKRIYLAMLLLSLLALGVTVLLIQAHYQPSETGSFCNINDYWNCDRVNKSIFAEIFGIPVSILGFLYYLVVSALYFALLRGFDFGKRFLPVSPRIMLTAMFIISTAGAALLLAQEFTVLGNYLAIAVVKALVFVALNVTIYKYCRTVTRPTVDMLGFMAILALFGVNFSLYLTDIELFVLQGICIFCLTQQMLIAIISVINLFALKNAHREAITLKSE